MSMSIQQRVIQENNVAVAMIEEGAYDEASYKLCTVFQAYQNCCENDYENEVSSACYNKSSISLDECMTKGHPMSSSIDPDFPFMYSDAIRISPEIAAAGIPKHDVSSIMLFNLALAYHLSALDSMNPDADLRKALHVYELLYTMQQENEENFLCNLMFVLSILNNIGIIHQWRNEDDIAARCFDKLLSVLMLISSNNNSQSTNNKNEEVVFRGFYRNVILNRPPCAGAA
eukprot:CAMPEP_0113633262 /NCGR_PEP_ID=MMETSP0017_2-20120614/17310_1 /TAXON_ID=2856 /ORGANISM="Cylindrotheca closterium" /LENGTH=229 /DNA_ID=CAMNT_0000543893 /DNA_START=76 /DNA_END=765 /DNA_ORIENTATION=- /assembly_acc=CAM_ASM_000147